MPNPVISPAWAASATYTVTDSPFLAVDVRLQELDEEPCQLVVTVPSGGTVHVLRDPADWSGAGTQLLAGGAWVTTPVSLGNWTVTVAPGAAETNPATIEATNPNGLAPTGLLRLVFASLGGAATVVEPSGGTLSIDRLLAAPSISGAQVSTGTPAKEKSPVTLAATAVATVEVNPAPSPLPALPAVAAQWSAEPSNAVAVVALPAAGTSASFTAPAVYSSVTLQFRIRAALDLNASGTIDATDPANSDVVSLQVDPVPHGMVLVLDRSGSMSSTLGGGDTKWYATVRAAHAWLDLFRTLRNGPAHKAAIITFEHDSCGWTPSAVHPPAAAATADVTVRDPQTAAGTQGLSSLSSLGNVNALSLGPPQTCTPIGDGLVLALDTLGAGLTPGSLGSVVLLTDGYENSGRVTIASSTSGGAATTFAAERVLHAAGNSFLGNRLFTIGVGGSVDEDRLNALTGGVGYYRLISDNVRAILPSFVGMLEEVLDAERVMPTAGVADPGNPSNAVYFDIPGGEQRVAFLVPWDNLNDTLLVAWRKQGATGDFTGDFTVVNDAHPSVVGSFRREGHGLVAINLATVTGAGTPPPTQWRLQHRNSANNTFQPLTDADVLCMRDLLTRSEITLDRHVYYTGDPIGLTCRIRTGGQAVTGAAVLVDVAGPGEGLGTFLATNASKIPGLGRGGEEGGLPIWPKGPDPDAGKALMFKFLLQQNGLDALPMVTPPTLTLSDDGNGDYRGALTDTLKEGSYTFRFRVTGTLADGSRFSRLFTRSTWVGVKPDPAASPVITTLVATLPGGATTYLVSFTPKSASGEFLGPFRGDVITLTITDGQLDGDLMDNFDGSYGQRILARRGQDPILGITVYDIPLRPGGPNVGRPADECAGIWGRALRCLLRWLLGLLRIRRSPARHDGRRDDRDLGSPRALES
jgi:hypothetical protein